MAADNESDADQAPETVDLEDDLVATLLEWVSENRERIAEKIDAALPLPYWAERFDKRIAELALKGLENAIEELTGEEDG